MGNENEKLDKDGKKKDFLMKVEIQTKMVMKWKEI